MCRDVCLCGAAKYKNVLNAIVEDGEATVLGLRRSKPLFFFFFGWEGAFLIQNSSTKDFQWALPHPHLTWGHSSAFQAYQWHVPIRAPIKSAPFPWNISKHFDGSGFPPAGFLESLSPHLFYPPSFPPLPPSPLPIPPLFWWTSDPQHLPWRAVVTETQSKTKEELLRRGKRALSHFLWWSQCCWWEEDALRAAGGGWHGFHRSVFFLFFFFFCEIWLLCGENELLLGELPPICWIGLNFLCSL